jgi:hypothetical protein
MTEHKRSVGRVESENHRPGAPRRLPDDATLSEILASGEFYAEIGRRYSVSDDAVRKHARRLGLEPIPPGQRQGSRRHAA